MTSRFRDDARLGSGRDPSERLGWSSARLQPWCAAGVLSIASRDGPPSRRERCPLLVEVDTAGLRHGGPGRAGRPWCRGRGGERGGGGNDAHGRKGTRRPAGLRRSRSSRGRPRGRRCGRGPSPRRHRNQGDAVVRREPDRDAAPADVLVEPAEEALEGPVSRSTPSATSREVGAEHVADVIHRRQRHEEHVGLLGRRVPEPHPQDHGARQIRHKAVAARR